MQNASRRPTRGGREPSRIPRRGAAAAIGTLAGLALLLGFRTPDPLPLTGLGAVSGLGSDTTAAIPPRTVAVAAGPDPTPAPTEAPTSAATLGTPAMPTPAPTAAPSPTDTPTPTTSQQVIDGKVVNTRYGPVQVEVTFSGGTIADVQALQLPNDRRYSAEISDYVAPYLREMALQAQSADIDVISGATYTSLAYARSLQSALDKAG